MSQPLDLFISAGELSGDYLGGALAKELKKAAPALKIAAVCGAHLRSCGIEEAFPMEKLQTMGILQILFSLPRLLKAFFFLRKTILERNPRLVVTIDYPGLHLRLLRSLRKKGFKGKLVHYVCPSIWVHGKKRKKLLEKYADLLLTLFPFEPELFSSSSLQVSYVGHPLTEKIQPLAFQSQRDYILSFPGSRLQEIATNLTSHIEAFFLLQAKRKELKLAISVAQKQLEETIRKICKSYNIEPTLVDSSHLPLFLPKTAVALAKSGTITLELALYNLPTVVTYKVSPIDYAILHYIWKVDLPFYCLPNILCKEQIFPECIGKNISSEQIAKEALFFLENPPLDISSKVKAVLGEHQSSREAAQLIIQRME